MSDPCYPPLAGGGWGGDFSRELKQTHIASLTRTEPRRPRSSASGGLVSGRPGLHARRGYPGLPSGSDKQAWSLSFSWRVSN